MLPALAAMMLVQTVVMIGVVAVPVLAPVLADELALPRDFAGPFQSLAFLGAAVATLVSGTLVGRFGGVRINQYCCALTAAGLLAPLAGMVPALVAGALLTGAGYGMATPGASHVLARVTSARTRGIVFAVKQSAVTLGGLVAGLLLPAVAAAAGWRAALVVVAVLAVVAAALVQPLRARLDDDRDPRRPFSIGRVAGSVTLVWRHPTLRPVSLAAFSYATVQLSLFALYVTVLVEQVGLTLVEAGWLYAVMQGTGVAARIAWGWVSDRLAGARTLLAWLGVGSIVSSMTLTLATPAWPWWALVVVSVALGATIVSWNGVYLAEIPRRVPQAEVSAATAGTVMFSFTGIVVGPAAFAGIAALSGGYVVPMLVLNALVAVSVVHLLRGRDEAPLQ